MSRLRTFFSRVRALLFRRRLDAAMDEDLRTHLEMLADDYVRAGMSPQEARRQARLRLGGIEQTKEAVRDARATFLDSIWQDVRYAVRTIRRDPGFAIVAVLTLALGIGANAAVFSVVDAALFRPLPYKSADRLVDVMVDAQTRDGGHVTIHATGAWAERLRAFKQVFEGVEAFTAPTSKALRAGSERNPSVGNISPNLPHFLGVTAELGRLLTADDVRAGDAIVISDAYWHRVYAGDRGVIGKTIPFSDGTRVIVGVMPPTFRYLVGATADAWLPIAQRDGEQLTARLRSGLTPERAQRELNAALTQRNRNASRVELLEAGWNRGGGGFGAVPTRTMLLTLLGAVGFVLAIGCANVANLLLSRTLTRRREIAVRRALGVTRLRLARQFFIEGLVLAGLGGAAAAGLAWGVTRALPSVVPANLVRSLFGASLPDVDLRVLGFGALTAILTGLVCGATPALRASRTVAADGLLASGSHVAGSSRRQRHVQDGFQALQVALTLVLLAGAGLLLASFIRMVTVPEGFNGRNLNYAMLECPDAWYRQPGHVAALFDTLTARVASLPGVRSVAPGPPPVAGYTGHFLPEENAGPMPIVVTLDYFPVTADYFRVAGIPLKEGRTFGPQDRQDSPAVAIISEDAARRFWPGQSAIGKRFRLFAGTPLLTIVGIAGRVRTIEMSREGVQAYLPATQYGFSRSLLFRTDRDLAPVIAAIREEARAIDAGVSVRAIGTVEGLFVDLDPIGMPRFHAVLMGVFAAIGLLTAAVGLYGVLSHCVARRTQEIGVRMTLGAPPSRIRWMVTRQAISSVVPGAIVGLAGIAALGRVLRSFLFEISPADPLVLGVAVGLMTVVSAVAAYVPARRATRVDPIAALRCE